MDQRFFNKQSHHLPAMARDKLANAARTDPGVPPGESFARTKAVQRAIDRVRLFYPDYFKEEQ